MLEKWYVVYTKPRSEEKVCRLLESKSVEVFVPKMAVTKKKKRARITIIEPVFPNYVFVRLGLNPNFWYALKWTPGVRRILSFNGLPSPVPDEVIDFLKKRTEKKGFVEPKATFNKGDKVRIKEGPFEGLVGIIEEARPSKERVKILMEILRTSTKVEIHVEELEKVLDILDI